jgi:fatty-acid desaturase
MTTINTAKSYQNDQINEDAGGDACTGQVVWSPVKSIWITTIFVLAIVGGVWTFSIEAFDNDKVYPWMEKYWLWQQLPLAVLMFVAGGIDWVIWGCCVRVAVCVTGHWFIGYMAHNNGGRHWHVEGASVQGYNIKFAALITMGENWHNNHHAFPGSALLGVEPGQMDPGWWVLMVLKKLGLVWNIKALGKSSVVAGNFSFQQ